MRLSEFGEIAREAAANAVSDEPRFGPGPDTCRWCLAKAHCKALADYNLETAIADFETEEFRDVRKMDSEQLAWALERSKALQDWLKALEARALSEALAGQPPPGFKVVEGRTQRRWKDERDAEAALERELGDDAFTRKLISPAQAEKLVGKRSELMNLVEKPPGNPTLAPASDKRPEMASTAVQDFS